MSVKAVIPREQAERDVDDALAYYLTQDAATAASGFIDALEQAYAHIGRHAAVAPTSLPNGHSTVTLFARFRGLSTSVPRATAV